MNYMFVKVKKGKMASLRYIDGTIKQVNEGEFIVLNGAEFERAKKDEVFEYSRVATNQDFENLSKPLKIDETKEGKK